MNEERTTQSIRIIVNIIRIVERRVMELIGDIGEIIQEMERKGEEKYLIGEYIKERNCLIESIPFLNKALRIAQKRNFGPKKADKVYAYVGKFSEFIVYAIKHLNVYRPEKLNEIYAYIKSIRDESRELKVA